VKKQYDEPEFELYSFNFENILEEPQMGGSQPEDQGQKDAW